MPPKKRSQRIDITLDIGLVEQLKAFADQHNLTVSGVVGQAVRSHLDGGGSSLSAGQAVLSSDIMDEMTAKMNEMISAHVSSAMNEYRASLKVTDTPSNVSVTADDAVKTVKRPPQKIDAGLRDGKVWIPDEIISRLQGYGASELMHATGDRVSKGTIHGIIKKGQKQTSPDFLELLIEALDLLDEERSSKDAAQGSIV